MLSAIGIGYRYPGGVAALDDVSLSVGRGRKLALLGANGAGKTTFLLHLNGLLRPQLGEIHLDGARMGYSRPALKAWRQRVGLVLQDPNDQLFAATVYEDVSFGPLNLGLSAAAARERIAAALAALDITDLADRPTHMLSLGQKKRVAIAGVVAMTPEFLILDEPTAGLDGDGSARLLSLLDDLHRGGTTIVIATHDTDLALEWADDAAVFCHARLERAGPAADVLADRALLARAALRCPWAVDLAELLNGDGAAADRPRSRTAVIDALQRRLMNGGP
jgi:cobalt transport protein ATP-binding subunit